MALTGCADAPATGEVNYGDNASVAKFLKTAAGWDERTGFRRSLVDIPLPSYGSGEDWKDALAVSADTYARLQRAANDRRSIPAAALRADLVTVFERRMAVRGGGSASMAMNIRIPAHVEWILGHLDGRTCPMISDQALLERSLSGYPFNSDLDPPVFTRLQSEMRASLADLKAIEVRLTPHEAACLRAGFLQFFEEKWRN